MCRLVVPALVVSADRIIWKLLLSDAIVQTEKVADRCVSISAANAAMVGLVSTARPALSTSCIIVVAFVD